MDRLCVTLDTENTQAKVTVTGVKRDESLWDAALRVLIEDWEWSPEDMERFGDAVEYFLIDPETWTWLKRIRWPVIQRVPDEPAVMFQRNQYLVNLCKIRTYRACRMHWSHERSMHYSIMEDRSSSGAGSYPS